MLNFRLLFVSILLFCAPVFTHCVLAQSKSGHQIFLKNGIITPEENISNYAGSKATSRLSQPDDKSLVVIEFEEIPSAGVRKQLKEQGIELLEYLPDFAYSATITGTLNATVLKAAKARSVTPLTAAHKITPSLLNGLIPSHAIKTVGTVDVRISFPKSFSAEEVKVKLIANHIKILSDLLKNYQLLEVRVPKNGLKQLAEFPFVQYVEAIPTEATPLNDKSAAGTKANVLSSLASAGFGLDGEGVVVGIGDDADPRRHIDTHNQVISNEIISTYAHGVHIAGTIAGAGIMNEKYRGYAPKTKLITRPNSKIWEDAANLVRDFGMVITNNAYAGSALETCDQFGSYNSSSGTLDREALELPYLQQVFAAGNSGSKPSCAEYPTGFGNVLGDYASAKNVISVGQTLANGLVSPYSSKGPVRDGRIKPDLTAPGTDIFSTIPVNAYVAGSGTSMASAAVSGGLALLYQQYRKNNSNNNPKNALIKAFACNGATDQGVPGPDYSYGFGSMNLVRSIAMLEARHYFTGQLGHGALNQHTIHVPDNNTAQLKVMLYWNDAPGSTLSGSKTLVNNLDLKLKQPDGTERFPSFPSASNAAAAATSGIDNINNAEQIVIENPAAGDYTLDVFAKLIPDGVQEYFVVYDLIEISTKLSYPIGKERLTKGDVIYISWESYGNPANTFTVQYSKDGGASWININTAVAATARQLSWTVPDVATEMAKVRILQNNTGIVRESEPFTILGIPIVVLSAIQCEGYATIQWSAVKDATGYQVMKMKGDEMTIEATTKDLNYTLSNLSKDVTYYIAVRAIKNDGFGRRGFAVSRTPNDGLCLGNISDNDLKMDLIVSPASSGRVNTSSALTASQAVTVRIKNLDDQISTGSFKVGYSVGDISASVHWETVNPVILGGTSFDYTFNEKVNLQNPGAYQLNVFVQKDGDGVSGNNSLSRTFKQLANPALQLPYFENFENAPQQEVLQNTIGVNGLDPYDLESSTTNGRLRTVVGSGISSSGSKALTLDVKEQSTASTENRIISTFNLSGYNVQTEEVRLTFKFMVHGPINTDYLDIVSIRGKDTDSWLPAFSMNIAEVNYNTDYQTVSIDVSDILKAAEKTLTSSFQVRFMQLGNDVTLTKSGRQGFSFDDVRLFKVTGSDIKIVGDDTNPTTFCGNDYAQDIKVTVTNKDFNDCFNLTVKMVVDDKDVYLRKISFIPGNSSSSLTFTQPTVSTFGKHTFKFSVEKSYDINPANNSFQTDVYNAPQISVGTRYLENFESGKGNWRSDGTNSSWSYGEPHSAKVKTAASGSYAWKTNISGNYNNNEVSYLYSPCFDISSLQNPALSFSASLDLESCPNNLCDVAYVEYSIGTGAWERLGAKNTGTNWYNRESNGVPAVWNVQDYTRWHVSTIPLPQANGQNFRIRFVFKSNASTAREGIAIDDIHIYDLNQEIYAGTAVSQVISNSNMIDNDWHNFAQDNKVIASIQTRYQNLGKVDVQGYINQGAARSSSGQYYLDRSFTVKPEINNLPNPVAVRLYFLDSEVEKLITASNNTASRKLESAYELSVTKFTDASGRNEDGLLSNNTDKTWTFFPSSDLIKVPYDKGYYIELKTQSFSEFWLAKEFLGNANSLPVDLISFTAKKKASADKTTEVLLEWVTSSEKDFSHFEIEMALSSENVRKDLFTKIGEVSGEGSTNSRSEYAFKDSEKYGTGSFYYRLKMIDTDQTFVYSPIRSVSFSETVAPQIYPNPSNGLFTVEFQGDAGREVKLNVYDLKGVLIKKISSNATGTIQKQKVDLSSPEFVPGLYLLEINSGKEQQVFKVIRN
jgi:hypothetical protein